MPQWEVVGGVDKGGILVRGGQSLSSPALADRLSTGAIVEEVVLEGDRLHYRLVSGNGPEQGWVSIRISGKELVVRKAPAEAPCAPPAEATEADAAAAGPLDFEETGDAYAFFSGGTAATEKTPWLKPLGKPKPDAKARLIIFSWTGNRGGQGSAHNLMKPASPAWAELLAPFEQLEVNYPGRGTRMKDPLYDDARAYAKDIAAALQVALANGRPFAFLGFSFGAVLAFECARLLQASGMGPLCVAAVSSEGPRWPGRAQMGLAKLSEAAFEQMLRDKGGTDFILNEPGMKKMFVPVINTDCKLEETYRYSASAGPLQCPLLVFYGTKPGHDKMKTVIAPEAANLWLEVTACKKLSSVTALDSDWYIFQEPATTEAVAKALADFCTPRLA